MILAQGKYYNFSSYLSLSPNDYGSASQILCTMNSSTNVKKLPSLMQIRPWKPEPWWSGLHHCFISSTLAATLIFSAKKKKGCWSSVALQYSGWAWCRTYSSWYNFLRQHWSYLSLWKSGHNSQEWNTFLLNITLLEIKLQKEASLCHLSLQRTS